MHQRANDFSLNMDETETWWERRKLLGPGDFAELKRKGGHRSEVELVEAEVALMVDMTEKNSSDPWCTT
jgi:hypothetical protein